MEKIQQIQQYADIYLLQIYFTCFGCHPSSGVLKTVPAASGTGHTSCAAAPLQCGLIGTGSMTCTGGYGYNFYYS